MKDAFAVADSQSGLGSHRRLLEQVLTPEVARTEGGSCAFSYN